MAVLASTTTVVGLLVLTMSAVSLNRTYEALEASRASARALVEEAPDAVFVADLTGRYTDVNGAACRLVGYSREEILGMTIADLILPADLDRLSRTRERLMQGNSTASDEWTLRRKDGSHVFVEVSAKIFPDGRWQALVRDTTEHRRLLGELRAAEAEQKFLADLGSALMSTAGDREIAEVVARRVVAERADACSIETLEEDGRLHARVFVHRDPTKAPLCRRIEALALEGRQQHVGATVRKTRRPMLIGSVTPGHLDAIAQTAEHRQTLRELEPKSILALPLLAHGGVVGSLLFISTTGDHHYTKEDLPLHRAGGDARGARGREGAPLPDRPGGDQAAGRRPERRRARSPQPARHHPAAGGPAPPPPGGRRARTTKPAEMIERAATRMNHLIQDLLDVARMEGGRLTIERSRIPASR